MIYMCTDIHNYAHLSQENTVKGLIDSVRRNNCSFFRTNYFLLTGLCSKFISDKFSIIYNF